MSLEAVAFAVAFPKRKQRIVLDLADQIAAQPSQIGDYPTTDAAGRSIENLLFEGYLFSLWIDHGSREVRIAGILGV